jgi:minor extracellular serine protease Vpr
MVKKSRIYPVLVLLALGIGVSFGQVPQSLIQQKLHPTFQTVVTSQAPLALSKGGYGPATPTVTTRDGQEVFDAIITTTNPGILRAKGIRVNSAFAQFATAQVTRDDLLNLIGLDEVRYIDPGSVNYPTLDLSLPETGANLVHAGFVNNTPYKGKGVIVVIYDTGIDWRHLDFRDPVDTTKSRILFIWDQTLTPIPGENTPSSASYGTEYTKQQIENEIDGTPAGFVREKDSNGHGTHVAGIAAGNGNSYFKKYVGMAPEADIIVVKGGDGSFSDARIIDGINYAGIKAAALGKPVVVNLSLGGQYGPHNGSNAYEAMINTFVSIPGRVVTVSAGNDGDRLIHTSGSVTPGTTTSIGITVPSYTPTSGTGNDKFQLDIWFNSSVGVTAEAVSPNNLRLQVGANNSGSAGSDADGAIDVYNFPSTLTDGSTLINLVVSDKSANTPRAGTWTLNLTGATATSTYDAWLSSSTVGSQTASIVNGNSQKTVGMPGTAEGAITVAAYVTKNGWPSFDGKNWVYSGTAVVGSRATFSGIGPSSDGRQKPDIAAPGQGISSSLSTMMTSIDTTFTMPGIRDQLMAGTSQAAPHVAGAAALLFQVSPTLTANQVKGFLTSTASTDAATGAAPNVLYGYGKLDVLRAAAKAFNPTSSVSRQVYAYDVDGANQIFYLVGSSSTLPTKYALRFTPTTSGQLVGMYMNITTASNRPIQGGGPLICEVWSNASGSLGGIPGTKIGKTVLWPFERLSTGTNNSIDMISAGVNVTAGQDYHLVIGVTNAQDTIKIRSDSPGSLVTNRSSSFIGSTWKNLPESFATTPANLRIRAVVLSFSGLVSVQNAGVLPQEFQLAQNYPNPFNPSTTIRWSVPVQTRIRLRVFDLMGREVASLVDELQAPGTYSLTWHGSDNAGTPLSSGVYFYRLEGSGKQLTKKMVLLK